MIQPSNHSDLPFDPHPRDWVEACGIADRNLRFECFVICESAVDQDSRLTVVGAYDALVVERLPCVIHVMTLAIRMRFWPAETGEHAFRLVMMDPDGRTVGREASGTFVVHGRWPDQSFACNLILYIHHTTIDSSGPFHFDFYLDGVLAARSPLHVMLPEPPIA